MSATSNPDSAAIRRLTVTDIGRMHADGERIPMLTAYDYPTAKILDEAGIPLLLVGDSLGRAMLGYENEIRVSMEDMLHHAGAVTRGAKRALVIGDMPFLAGGRPPKRRALPPRRRRPGGQARGRHADGQDDRDPRQGGNPRPGPHRADTAGDQRYRQGPGPGQVEGPGASTPPRRPCGPGGGRLLDRARAGP